MAKVDDIVLEHLKKIQAEQSASRERDAEILSRLAFLETGIARLTRDNAENYAEAVTDRHTLDGLKAPIERIERRLELHS